jgi:putative ABC transport system substrate-binding protein
LFPSVPHIWRTFLSLRRSTISLLFVTLLGAGTASAAEVAVLMSSEVPAWRPAIDALHRVAAAHNVVDYDLKGDRAEANKVLGTLKGRNVILVVMGNLAAQAARELMPEVPLVFCMVPDPVKFGLVGLPNTTGVSFMLPVKNQLAAFRMVNPRASKIGVIYNAENSGRIVQEAQKAAAIVHLILAERAVPSEKEIPEALRSLLKGQDAIDALWIPPDPMLLGDETRRFLLSESFKAGKPVYAFSSSLVQEGALVADGPDFASIGEEAGEMVVRIASGDRNKIDMSIPKPELVVNKKMADKLKIDIPPEALRLANKVF